MWAGSANNTLLLVRIEGSSDGSNDGSIKRDTLPGRGSDPGQGGEFTDHTRSSNREAGAKIRPENGKPQITHSRSYKRFHAMRTISFPHLMFTHICPNLGDQLLN